MELQFKDLQNGTEILVEGEAYEGGVYIVKEAHKGFCIASSEDGEEIIAIPEELVESGDVLLYSVETKDGEVEETLKFDSVEAMLMHLMSEEKAPTTRPTEAPHTFFTPYGKDNPWLLGDWVGEGVEKAQFGTYVRVKPVDTDLSGVEPNLSFEEAADKAIYNFNKARNELLDLSGCTEGYNTQWLGAQLVSFTQEEIEAMYAVLGFVDNNEHIHNAMIKMQPLVDECTHEDNLEKVQINIGEEGVPSLQGMSMMDNAMSISFKE